MIQKINVRKKYKNEQKKRAREDAAYRDKENA
jgi:hypothetical protein